MTGKFIMIVACMLLPQALASSVENPANGLTSFQVVAQFPDGVWNGNCSSTILRNLPTRCAQALTANSSASETLACSIISQPHTDGILPFGMYPTAAPLSTELLSVPQQSLTQIFTDCALAQMIQDGCINFQARGSNQVYTTETYSTSDDYETTVTNSYDFVVDAFADYGSVTVKGGYDKSTAQKSSTSSITKEYSVKQIWQQTLGRLTYDTCVRSASVEKYLSSEYLAEWEAVSNINDVSALLVDPIFRTLMDKGFQVPTNFEYSIRYASSVYGTYSQDIHDTSSSMQEAITASLDVSYTGFTTSISTSMKTAMDSTLQDTSVTKTSFTQDAAYGECNFGDLFSSTDPNRWMDVLEQCSQDTLQNLNKLDRPSRVSSGGFYTIFSILDSVKYFEGIALTKATLYAALNKYYAFCTCTKPNYWQQLNDDGQVVDQGMNYYGDCHYGNGTAIVETSVISIPGVAVIALPVNIECKGASWMYFDSN